MIKNPYLGHCYVSVYLADAVQKLPLIFHIHWLRLIQGTRPADFDVPILFHNFTSILDHLNLVAQITPKGNVSLMPQSWTRFRRTAINDGSCVGSDMMSIETGIASCWN